MIELKENFQLCYFAPQNSQGEAMNLLSFGFRQFTDTYIYKNQETLKELCKKISTPPDIEKISGFIFNHLIDSIKIHICFENFLKGIFLANNIIIHKLDKTRLPNLWEKQRTEPIHRDEVVRMSSWEENPKVNLPDPNMRKQIKGITRWTLGTNILTKPGYLEKINFDRNVLDIINPYLEYRNNLHYYSGESFTLSEVDYENFRKVVDFVNKNVVRIQNKLVENCGKGVSYKLKEL